MDLKTRSLKIHEEYQGKIEVNCKVKDLDQDKLSLLYSPGVASPCLEIQKNEMDAYIYTAKQNMVGIISNGSAVLGLGDIGAQASMPVMEGKAILLKEFAGVDAFPLVIESYDIDEIVNSVKLFSKSFGAINLEDISAPNCFEIEQRLINALDIPVFHDDQHGTAIVVLAGLINALKLVKKDIKDIKVVVNGIGAAGVNIVLLLQQFGATNIVMMDKYGAICDDNKQFMHFKHLELNELDSNPNINYSSLKDALVDADVFIGCSVANCVDEEMVKSMNQDAIIFALANPNPEIDYDLAKKAGVRVMATGRSDYPNQVNNVLAFPGIFKGALECLASKITVDMKLAASLAIASLIEENELSDEYVIPSCFDKRVVEVVSNAVKECAIKNNIIKK